MDVFFNLVVFSFEICVSRVPRVSYMVRVAYIGLLLWNGLFLCFVSFVSIEESFRLGESFVDKDIERILDE